ncbi:MAG: hypothetical protein FJ008_07450 [Chloroflexi bacterium]|nr:hypothetical protein [Chloroflexota bacterium]MBM3175715.1 hypothetical protein [Chloroflexota bacterium]MBM4450475.1 hypothetical protein [Chloroflexota bacterium]
MKEMRINLAVGQNRGLTLVELLVAIAIGTAIVGVMSMSIVSILKITPLNNDRAVVFQQVQNAGYHISRDVQMAQVVTPEPSSGVLVSIVWDEWNGTHNEVEYVFDGDKLRRKLNGASPGRLIAEYVVVADTSFGAVGGGDGTYRLTMKASKGEASLQRTYDVTTRLSN